MGAKTVLQRDEVDKSKLVALIAKKRKRESKYLEFKEKFDVNQSQDWCELIKDVIAMANSGGGDIVIGVKNGGGFSGADLGAFLAVDPSQITDKLAKYTGHEFSDLEIQEFRIKSFRIAIMTIREASIPMVFVNPGTYRDPSDENHQRTAFGKGTLYFRHGAKSEPANHSDLREAFDRELLRQRKVWSQNIRKVVTAPIGSQVRVIPARLVQPNDLHASPMRVVEDPTAPPYHLVTPDKTHPHRQKDVVALVNQEVGDVLKITAYDVQCVRQVYGINHTRPDFFFKSKFASPQYSQNFVDWLVQEYKRNHDFFKQARHAVKQAQNVPSRRK